MRIVEVEAKNFRIPHFRFIPPDSNLIILNGPNGSGKTTVLESVSWVFTGRLSTFEGSLSGRMRDSDITKFLTANYPVTVRVILEDRAGRQVDIRRERRKLEKEETDRKKKAVLVDMLYVNGIAADEKTFAEQVNSLLDVDLAIFPSSHYLSQNMLFDSLATDPSLRAEVISKILNTDWLADLRRSLTESLEGFRENRTKLSSELSKIIGEIDDLHLNRDWSHFQSLSEEYSLDGLRLRDPSLPSFSDLEDRIHELLSLLGSLPAELSEKCRDEIVYVDLREKFEDLPSHLGKVMYLISEAAGNESQRVSSMDAVVRDLLNDLSFLQSGEENRWKNEVNTLSDCLDVVLGKIRGTLEEMDDLEKRSVDLNLVTGRLDDLRRELRILENSAGDVESAWSKLDKGRKKIADLRSLLKENLALKNNLGTFIDTLAPLLARKTRLEQDLGEKRVYSREQTLSDLLGTVDEIQITLEKNSMTLQSISHAPSIRDRIREDDDVVDLVSRLLTELESVVPGVAMNSQSERLGLLEKQILEDENLIGEITREERECLAISGLIGELDEEIVALRGRKEKIEIQLEELGKKKEEYDRLQNDLHSKVDEWGNLDSLNRKLRDIRSKLVHSRDRFTELVLEMNCIESKIVSLPPLLVRWADLREGVPSHAGQGVGGSLVDADEDEMVILPSELMKLDLMDAHLEKFELSGINSELSASLAQYHELETLFKEKQNLMSILCEKREIRTQRMKQISFFLFFSSVLIGTLFIWTDMPVAIIYFILAVISSVFISNKKVTNRICDLVFVRDVSALRHLSKSLYELGKEKELMEAKLNALKGFGPKKSELRNLISSYREQLELEEQIEQRMATVSILDEKIKKLKFDEVLEVYNSLVFEKFHLTRSSEEIAARKRTEESKLNEKRNRVTFRSGDLREHVDQKKREKDSLKVEISLHHELSSKKGRLRRSAEILSQFRELESKQKEIEDLKGKIRVLMDSLLPPVMAEIKDGRVPPELLPPEWVGQEDREDFAGILEVQDQFSKKLGTYIGSLEKKIQDEGKVKTDLETHMSRLMELHDAIRRLDPENAKREKVILKEKMEILSQTYISLSEERSAIEKHLLSSQSELNNVMMRAEKARKSLIDFHSRNGMPLSEIRDLGPESLLERKTSLKKRLHLLEQAAEKVRSIQDDATKLVNLLKISESIKRKLKENEGWLKDLEYQQMKTESKIRHFRELESAILFLVNSVEGFNSDFENNLLTSLKESFFENFRALGGHPTFDFLSLELDIKRRKPFFEVKAGFGKDYCASVQHIMSCGQQVTVLLSLFFAMIQHSRMTSSRHLNWISLDEPNQYLDERRCHYLGDFLRSFIHRDPHLQIWIATSAPHSFWDGSEMPEMAIVNIPEEIQTDSRSNRYGKFIRKPAVSLSPSRKMSIETANVFSESKDFEEEIRVEIRKMLEEPADEDFFSDLLPDSIPEKVDSSSIIVLQGEHVRKCTICGTHFHSITYSSVCPKTECLRHYRSAMFGGDLTSTIN